MIIQPETIDDVVALTSVKFPTFGGGKVSSWGNPIAHALKDEPPQFAAGVDVREVVEFIAEAIRKIDNVPHKEEGGFKI